MMATAMSVSVNVNALRFTMRIAAVRRRRKNIRLFWGNQR
jgi:hypothetical protein